MVLFAASASLGSAYCQGPTTDEPTHLEWSRRLLDRGITERRSNEYFESKTPITIANVLARRLARRALGTADTRALLFWARVPTVVAFMGLLAAVFVVGRAWVGRRAAHLATIACALDPNLIAHASLTTVDLVYALAHLLALVAIVRFARRPALVTGALLGLAIGFAFTVKFTAVLLLPALALAVVARDVRPRLSVRGVAVIAAGLVLAGAVAAGVVCAAYLFQQVAQPLQAIEWKSGPMAAVARSAPHLRLPLPVDFLTGFDLSLAHERGMKWAVVVLGRQHPRGVWYYFALLWTMKTPLLVLLLQVYAYGRAFRERFWNDGRLRFLALNLVLLLGYFSFAFHTQLGFRFVLMCIPLGYLLAASGLETVPATRWATLAGTAALLVALAENAVYLGNHLAFTNVAVQPKKDVFRWISDSNVDWGQNQDKVDPYLLRAGLSRARLDPTHVMPGPMLLRHDLASGNFRFERYRWLRENVEPTTHFDHTFLLFDVGALQFERFLQEARRCAPSPPEPVLCPEGEAAFPSVPGGPLSLEKSRLGRGWIVCVATRRGSDLVFSGREGRLLLDHVGSLRSGPDFVQPGQEAWYRLDPGRHVFIGSAVTDFEGDWRVVRGDPSLGVRERPGRTGNPPPATPHGDPPQEQKSIQLQRKP